MSKTILLGKSLFLIIILFLFCFCVNFAFAEDTTYESQNYEMQGQEDFSGGTSSSQNYEVYGILTDINDVPEWGATASPTPSVSPTKEVSPTPSAPPKSDLEIFFDNLRDWLKTDFAKDLLAGLTTVAGIMGLLSLLTNFLLNFPWLTALSQIWSRILFILGWNRKKKWWGIVYDAESNQPIPLATVRIFNQEEKLLATEITDKDGRFGFIVSPGSYYMQAIKANYSFPSKIVTRDYHREIFEVKDDSQILNISIPMDPDIGKLGGRIHFVSKFLDVLNFVRMPILILGTILSILFVIFLPDTINFLVLAFYVILWIIEIYQMRHIKTYGIVASLDDNIPQNLAIVRVIDTSSNKLVTTRVTNIDGKYFQFVNPGEYSITATKEGFDQYKLLDLTLKKGEIIARDIYLKRKDNK